MKDNDKYRIFNEFNRRKVCEMRWDEMLDIYKDKNITKSARRYKY